jgi:cyclopropane-fatty-acyl-phospholipid synthase
MNTTTATSPPAAVPGATPAAARRVLNLLARLPQGRLDLQLPDGQVQRLPGASGQPVGSMVLHNWAVFERTLKAGDIGLAESYIDGDWDSPDLAALLRLCIRNREHIEGLVYGRWWGALATGCATCCGATPAAAAPRTSTPTTTWATASTACGWTRP